jgi:hypothetical protein
MRVQDETLQLADFKGDVNASGPGIPQKAIKALLAGQMDANWGRENGLGQCDQPESMTAPSGRRFDVKDDARPGSRLSMSIADQINIDRFTGTGSGAAGGAADEVVRRYGASRPRAAH